MPLNKSLWKGVYLSFAEAGGDLDAFDSDIWIDKQKSRVLESLQKYHTNDAISKDYPLPMVIAMLLVQQQSLEVLDFGGGMGLQYLDVISKVPDAKDKLDYYVVDGKASIDNRPIEINQFAKLHFSSELDDLNIKVDIIHIGSTLQYIEKWEDVLSNLVERFEPKYFVFSDLLAGDITTFISHQIFYNKKIPITMLNVKEFTEKMSRLSFTPIYKTYFETRILGQNEFPNIALPENNKIKHAMHMICKRNFE